jgi:hypothetical protein
MLWGQSKVNLASLYARDLSHKKATIFEFLDFGWPCRCFHTPLEYFFESCKTLNTSIIADSDQRWVCDDKPAALEEQDLANLGRHHRAPWWMRSLLAWKRIHRLTTRQIRDAQSSNMMILLRPRGPPVKLCR